MRLSNEELMRVVRVRRGALKIGEFQLRPGEKGLSLFAHDPAITTEQLMQAVRDAGKQGELATAIVPVQVILDLGLVIVRTPGGTPDAEVNRFHREVRLKWWKRAWLRIRRMSIADHFNRSYSDAIFGSARLES